MHPHTVALDWDRIARRIASDVGPLRLFCHLWHDGKTTALRLEHEKQHPEVFKSQWLVELDRRFHSADNVAGQHLLTRWSPPSWFVVSFAPAGFPASHSTDFACAATFTEAVSYLYRCCRDASFFPDDVALDPVSERLVLRLRGEEFATVHRLQLERPTASHDQLRRARSTLIGFRHADDWHNELVRRIARWPGLSSFSQAITTPVSPIGGNSCIAHLPVPSEWLFNAKCILQEAGLDVSTAAQQRFVSAYFGAQSFNHLVGGQAELCATLAGPWALEVREGEHLRSRTVFADPFEAFCSLSANLRGAIGGWSTPMLDVHHDDRTRFQMIVSDGKIYEPGADHFILEGVAPAVSFEDDGSSLAAVQTALSSHQSGLLADLFMVGTTGGERVAISLAESRLVATHNDGGLRYVFHTDEASSHVYCSRFDAAGNAVGRDSGAPLYKASLRHEPDVGAWVLYADCHSTHAVDAFPSLPTKTVSAVCALFEDSPFNQRPASHEMSPQDKHMALSFLDEDRQARTMAR